MVITILRKLNKELTLKDYNVIVAEGIFSALSACLLKNYYLVRFNKKILVVSRVGRHWTDHSNKILWWCAFMNSDKILCPLKNNIADWKDKILFKRLIKKTQIIKNPIYVPTINLIKQKKRSDFIVIGRNVPQKRLPDALNFASKLAESYNEHVHFFTDNLDEFHMIDNIITHDFSPRIWQDFGRVRALINFALYEGYSMITAEAQTLGIPTISLCGPSGQNDLIKELNCGIILNQSESIHEAKIFLEKWGYRQNRKFLQNSNDEFVTQFYNSVWRS